MVGLPCLLPSARQKKSDKGNILQPTEESCNLGAAQVRPPLLRYLGPLPHRVVVLSPPALPIPPRGAPE